LSELFRVDLDLINLFKKFAILIVQADIKALTPVDHVTVLARGLSDFEASDLTIWLLVLGNDTVASLSLDPVLSPLSQVQRLIRLWLIIALLECADEIRKSGVLPLVLLEVYFESLAECFPVHQEDKLLNESWALAISDTVN
jgi:hypothetical protein